MLSATAPGRRASIGQANGLLWRELKVKSAMVLFALCDVGAVDAMLRSGLLAQAQG